MLPTVTCSWCQKEVLHYPCLWSFCLSTLLHQDRCSWNHPGKQIRELTEWTTLIRWTKRGEQSRLLVWSTLSCDSQGHNIAGAGKRQSSQNQNVSSGKSASLGQSKMLTKVKQTNQESVTSLRRYHGHLEKTGSNTEVPALQREETLCQR